MARREFETLTPQMFYILLALRIPRHGCEAASIGKIWCFQKWTMELLK